MKLIYKIFYSFLLVSFITTSYAQSGFVTGFGEEDNGGYGSFSLSLGELEYLNFFGGNYQITEGVQQSYLQQNFACLSNVRVPVGDSCSAVLTTDMFTSPEYRRLFIFASQDEIPSALSPDQVGMEYVVYGEGNWMYGIYNVIPDDKGMHQLICWGTFVTEDKIDPRFTGDKTGQTDLVGTNQIDESVFNQFGTYKEINYLVWDDTLGASGQTFLPHLWTCYQSTNHAGADFTWPNDDARFYDTIRITPDYTGFMSIIAKSKLNTNESQLEGTFDPVIAVYDESFDPENPCQNLIAFGESSFIPNPLAGLGFLNEESAGAIDGTVQDEGDVFAPWLLHENPVVNMDIKVENGREYVVVITHREVSSSNFSRFQTDRFFEVYFMTDNFNESGLISDNVTKNIIAQYDSLLADTSFAYFDFICADLEEVMLSNETTYDESRYTGGDIHEMASYLNTAADRAAVGTAWMGIANALLGVQGRDTALIDLNELDLNRPTHAAARLFMDSLLLNYGYMPMVIENCDSWDVVITDEYESYGDCGIDITGWEAQEEGLNISGIIKRTFVVKDGGTKTDLDSAYIQLVFRNPNLYDVRLPHINVNLECDEIDEGVASTDPSVTGYPFVSTLTGFVELTPSSEVCNLAASYEDLERVETCANTFKFRREWTIYDWCRPATSVVYNQIINIGDWTAPVKDTDGYMFFTENADECSGSLVLEAPSYDDACGIVSISAKIYAGAPSINNEVGFFDASQGGEGVLEDMPFGTYYVVWTAQDDCGNLAPRDTITETFEDVVSPSCVIDDLRSITITNYGTIDAEEEVALSDRGEAWMTAERLDEGSWDNCGDIISKEVRRMTDAGMTEWGEAIMFTCADEGESILVELQVTDEAGNSSICWTNIVPEDKTRPECRQIGNVNYHCDEIPVGYDANGGDFLWEEFFDDSLTLENISNVALCGSNMDVVETEVVIADCGYGYVNRYYRVFRNIDDKVLADTCRMSLVFAENHNYSITFPEDSEVSSCSELTGDGISFDEIGCDLVTVSTTDETFNATADECYKIFRTYNVINWCEFEEEGTPITVKRVDLNKDGQAGDEITIRVAYEDQISQIHVNYQGLDRIPDTVTVGRRTSSDSLVYTFDGALKDDAVTMNSYTQSNINKFWTSAATTHSEGYFTYTQVLKVFDSEEPTIDFSAAIDSFPSYESKICDGSVEIVATIEDDCTADEAQITIQEVRLDANNDNAGSVNTTDGNFDLIVDPATYAKEGTLFTFNDVLPEGTHKLQVVARDGCGNVRVESHVFTVYDAKAPVPLCIDGLAIELMPEGNGTAGVAEIKATDFIVDGYVPNDCNGPVTYRITRETSDLTAVLSASDLDVALLLTCADLSVTQVAIVATDASGNKNSDFCVTDITVQDNVTPCESAAQIGGLVATEDNNVVSGVEISLNDDRNIVTAVDGGYFFSGLVLGADYSIVPRKDEGHLNGVSTYDLVLISKHILGLTPLSSPYKLIAADVNQSNSISTLDLIQLRRMILNLDDQFTNNTSWRFIPAEYSFPNASNPWAAAFPEVLNINDFNGNANGDFVAIKVGDVNNSSTIDVQPRSNTSFALNVEDLAVKAGNEYTVSFKATAADVEGFQVALGYEGLELVDIVEGVVKADHFGTKFAGEGVLLTSWNGTAAEGELFSLTFRATQDVVLSKALSVSTRHLNAEAYNIAGEAMNVAIDFNSGAVAEASFELKQNTPNPFKGETVIGFNLAEASNATLTINDVTGRVLKVVRGDFAKGANQVSINSKELPSAGVLYYTLTAGAYTATKKMIIMD